MPVAPPEAPATAAEQMPKSTLMFAPQESATSPGESLLEEPAATATPEPGPAPMAGAVPEGQTTASAPPAAAPSPKTDDYTTVTVFYGTDRQPLENVAPSATGYLAWLAVTAGFALLTMLLIGLAIYRAFQRRRLILLGLGSLASAAATLVVASLVPMETSATLARVYGNARGPVELGTCEVTIPKQHEVGQVERPSIFRLEFREDPTQHVILQSVTPEPTDAFFTKLRVHVENSAQKEAFVFVHGFNVTFEAAAQRTAQMAYDLQFQGAPIFFSWPSQGGLLQYTVDETNVVWTVPHLKEFLRDVARRSGARSVHLIAHSMGNRALTAALQAMTYEAQETLPKFREVVLTAPDIDAEIFRRDIAPAVVRTADRVTLYASSNDEALVLSKQLHGYARAGDSGEGLLLLSGIDTIDVSSVDTSLLGHSYYGENRSVLDDLWDLLHEAKPPGQRRWLLQKTWDNMKYWVFVVDQARLQATLPHANGQ